MSILDRNYIESALLIRIDVAEYKTSPSTYAPETLLFSDSMTKITATINGVDEVYIPCSNFLSITSTRSELKSSTAQVSISLSGIPDSALTELMTSKIKYSPVRILRGLLDPQTNRPLSGDNIVGRFFGMVTDVVFDENWGDNDNSNTVTFVCMSKQEIFSKNHNGRRTNGDDMRAKFPNDASFDNVSTLIGENFNFGIPNAVEYQHYTQGLKV